MNAEIEDLMDHSIDYAQDLLDETLEFYPFGAWIDTKGGVHPLEFEFDKKQMPTVEKVLSELKTYCDSEMEAKNMNAYGLTFESELVLAEGEDAVKCISLGIVHREEKDIPKFYVPYTINEDKTVEYSELFGVK
jgi:hypothetical protein